MNAVAKQRRASRRRTSLKEAAQAPSRAVNHFSMRVDQINSGLRIRMDCPLTWKHLAAIAAAASSLFGLGAMLHGSTIPQHNRVDRIEQAERVQGEKILPDSSN